MEIKRIIPEFMLMVSRIFGARPVVKYDEIPDDRIIEISIPDDIFIDILSRLPADDVMKCQSVCKKWHAITSTPYFAELHLKRGATFAPCSIFVEWMDNFTQRRFHVYDTVGTNRMTFWRKRISTNIYKQWFDKDIIAEFRPYVSCSVDGLVAVICEQVDKTVFILNPCTKELAVVQVPFGIVPPCGIYRDNLTREYKLLMITCSSDTDLFQYYVAGLDTMVLKKLEYSSSWSDTGYQRMIYTEGYLHWFVKDKKATGGDTCNTKIMVFNTTSEEFRVFPHPGDQLNCREVHKPHNCMMLGETIGKLRLIRFSSENYLQIWILEDHEDWAWSKRYVFDRFSCDFITNHLQVRYVGVYNEELLLQMYRKPSDIRDTYWYNLEHNTIRKAPTPTFEIGRFRMFPYTKTLVFPTPLTTSIKKTLMHSTPCRVLNFDSIS